MEIAPFLYLSSVSPSSRLFFLVFLSVGFVDLIPRFCAQPYGCKERKRKKESERMNGAKSSECAFDERWLFLHFCRPYFWIFVAAVADGATVPLLQTGVCSKNAGPRLVVCVAMSTPTNTQWHACTREFNLSCHIVCDCLCSTHTRMHLHPAWRVLKTTTVCHCIVYQFSRLTLLLPFI